ncbi:MAG: hypothetical protein CL867_03660 [Cytophagaceae bacterium]|nr:hypothetical protein [Cytophagaceae bacterium]
MSLPQDKQNINFGKDGCDNCQWYVVLDGVMGGRSSGAIELTNSSVVFQGSISLANNGGFASFRSDYGQYDLSQFKEVAIRYRSTGQDFAFTLNKYRRFYRPNFKADLPVTDGQWVTKNIPWEGFKRYRLGNRLSGALTTDDLKKVIRMGFISNEKKASPFNFEVDYIRFQ